MSGLVAGMVAPCERKEAHDWLGEALSVGRDGYGI